MWKDKGATKLEMFKAIEPLKIMNGAKETLHELKKRGFKLAIISGTISVIVEKFFPDYEKIFDDVFLNRIIFDEKGKIKEVNATPYDIDHKETALKKIAERENLSLKECVFVGDHLNDLKILKTAGLGIAFDPKAKEVEEADIQAEILNDLGLI